MEMPFLQQCPTRSVHHGKIHLSYLLLVLTPHQLRDRGPVLQLLLQELVDSERHGLAGSDTHHTRRDALVEGVEALRLEHVTRDECYSAPCALAGLGGSLLEACLDGVDGGVGEGTHGTRDETNEGCLVGGELGVGVGWLPSLESRFELRVGSEVNSLVGSW